jgi:hypothetical protein
MGEVVFNASEMCIDAGTMKNLPIAKLNHGIFTNALAEIAFETASHFSGIHGIAIEALSHLDSGVVIDRVVLTNQEILSWLFVRTPDFDCPSIGGSKRAA